MTDGMPEERKLLGEILGAFVRNPEMVDNLEGIARWRLLNARIRSEVENTKEALDHLVSQGYLLAFETARGLFFRMNAEKLAAAKSFVQELSGTYGKRTSNLSQERNAVPITITNQTKRLLLVPLTSRTTLYLAPGATSAPVAESEVNQNEKVEKLARLGLISIVRASSKTADKPRK